VNNLITDEMDKDHNGFPNLETYGFCLWLGNNDILHRLAFHFMNDNHVIPSDVQPLVAAMELLSNAGGKVDTNASPAWRMSIDMGSAPDCFTKVDSVFLADWLNEEFEPVA
tara:strand:- start:1656 stop:1988 length:333 start_codon:yes stop_codon:yes gene_type:complete